MTKIGMFAVPTCIVLFATIGFGVGAQSSKRADPDSKTQTESPAIARNDGQPSLELKEYIVEPPDLIRIEVPKAPPGRQITGEHLVRPDGRITLGYYGEVFVAGLTTREIKEKVVRHLRQYMSDEDLGLVAEVDPETKKPTRIREPRDSDRVSVDVAAFNSKCYYVQGAFAAPGKLPVSGRATVLDVVALAGGLMPTADHKNVYLYRKNPKGGAHEKLHVEIDEILFGAGSPTNYELQPGDRLVVLPKGESGSSAGQSNLDSAKAAGGSGSSRERMPTQEEWRTLSPEQKLDVMGLRIIEMQSQLNKIMEKLDKP